MTLLPSFNLLRALCLWWTYLSLSRLSLFALLVASSNDPSTAYAESVVQKSTAPTSHMIKAWLKVNAGTQRYRWRSGEDLGAHLDITFQENDLGEIEITEESYGERFDGEQSDHYTLTHRRFSSESPYPLLEAEWYKQAKGESHLTRWQVNSWRKNKQREGNSARLGQFIETSTPLKRPQLTDQAQLRRHAETTLQSIEDVTLTRRTLSTQETLGSHLGLSYRGAPLAKDVFMLTTSGETRYLLSKVDQRLVKQGDSWLEVSEIKVVDQRGRASRVILDHTFKVLSLSLSTEQQLFATPQLDEPLSSLSQLLYVKGRPSPKTLKSLTAIYRQRAQNCSSIKGQHRPARSLKPRVNFSATGQMTEIGFERRPVWGEYERCIAQEISQYNTPLTTDRATLLIGALSP